MKHAQPTKASQGKISTFLRALKQAYSPHRSTRNTIRGTNQYPSSSKVGAGDITARRRLPHQELLY